MKEKRWGEKIKKARKEIANSRRQEEKKRRQIEAEGQQQRAEIERQKQEYLARIDQQYESRTPVDTEYQSYMEELKDQLSKGPS